MKVIVRILFLIIVSSIFINCQKNDEKSNFSVVDLKKSEDKLSFKFSITNTYSDTILIKNYSDVYYTSLDIPTFIFCGIKMTLTERYKDLEDQFFGPPKFEQYMMTFEESTRCNELPKFKLAPKQSICLTAYLSSDDKDRLKKIFDISNDNELDFVFSFMFQNKINPAEDKESTSSAFTLKYDDVN